MLTIEPYVGLQLVILRMVCSSFFEASVADRKDGVRVLSIEIVRMESDVTAEAVVDSVSKKMSEAMEASGLPRGVRQNYSS